MAEHQPINWDNRWLLEKYFPDMPPADLPVPAWNPSACAENRALAALRVWMAVWYTPRVTLPKRTKDTRMGYDRFRTWRE